MRGFELLRVRRSHTELYDIPTGDKGVDTFFLMYNYHPNKRCLLWIEPAVGQWCVIGRRQLRLKVNSKIFYFRKEDLDRRS